MGLDVERLARLEKCVEDLEVDMRAVMHELGGVANGNADHKPIRHRLHSLENGQAALVLVESAVKEMRKERLARDQERRAIVSGWLGYAIVGFSAIGAIGVVVTIVSGAQ